MRIGILTLPFNLNYGGFLQAFALMTVLKKMGHEPEMIMRRHNKKKVSAFFILKYAIKGIAKSILRGRHYPIIYNVENDYRIRGRQMLSFVDKNIRPQSPFLYSTEELRAYCKDRFDAYLVGSDQLWRPDYVPDITNFFLDFTEGWDVKRIAYAASFGNDSPCYTDKEKEACRKLIQGFDAVSLRETGGKRVFENLGWKYNDLQVVLDPTLLLTMDDYNRLLPEKESESNHKIFAYILDENERIDRFLRSLSKTQGKEIWRFPVKRSPMLPIEDWLTAFRDCDFIVTDSFHGTAFSIIYNKQFVVLGNPERGQSRFETLLGHFGLENRLIYNVDSPINLPTINFSNVNKILEEKRQLSCDFLSNSLH